MGLHRNHVAQTLAMIALGTSALACNIGSGYEPAPDSLKATPPAPKKPAPAATWEVKYGVKLTFQLPTKSTDPYDKPHCDFTLNGKKDAPTPELQLHCSHLTRPLEVTFEGKTQEVSQHETSPYDAFHFDADFNRRLGGVKLDALKEQMNVKFVIPLELTFKFDGYEPMKVSPPSVWISSDVYLGWARGVRFSNPEPPDDGKMSAILLNEGYSGHMLVGEGRTLSDLDWIVIQRDSTTGPVVSCYGGAYVLRLEADITIHDRRTGAVVEEHHLAKKSAGCPSSIVTAGRTEYQSAVTRDDVARWVRTRFGVARGK